MDGANENIPGKSLKPLVTNNNDGVLVDDAKLVSDCRNNFFAHVGESKSNGVHPFGDKLNMGKPSALH